MKDAINNILQINDSYQAPNRLMEVLKGSQKKRDAIFMQFLELWNYDLDADNFRLYFEQEHANRKGKKQDFTPATVGNILSKLTGKSNATADVCSGTGGLTIAKWTQDRINKGFMRYKPSNFIYQCYELSDRAVPFLLFNLSIRGINAKIFHGDVLEQKYKAIYYTMNEEDNALGFSGLVEVKPKTGKVFTEQKTKQIEQPKLFNNDNDKNKIGRSF